MMTHSITEAPLHKDKQQFDFRIAGFQVLSFLNVESYIFTVFQALKSLRSHMIMKDKQQAAMDDFIFQI